MADLDHRPCICHEHKPECDCDLTFKENNKTDYTVEIMLIIMGGILFIGFMFAIR